MSCAISNGRESCTTGGSTLFSAQGTAEVLIPVEAPPIPSSPINGAPTKAHTAGLFGCLLYLVYFLF
jgi:hypothetical protein